MQTSQLTSQAHTTAYSFHKATSHSTCQATASLWWYVINITVLEKKLGMENPRCHFTHPTGLEVERSGLVPAQLLPVSHQPASPSNKKVIKKKGGGGVVL